jgi:hypothetical protein
MKAILYIIIISILFNACNNKIDEIKPEIDLSKPGAFPGNCDTLYFGETFTFNALFTDNFELGSFSIDIHHNFDHHSHSTEVSECVLDPIKNPVNPFVFIEDFDIPSGSKSYQAQIPIHLEINNETGPFDEGDYHFFISLTDKEGWSAQKGISIKILTRK